MLQNITCRWDKDGLIMKKLRIFLASPGELQEERNIVSLVVDELQRTIGKMMQVEIELIRWETDAWPDVGKDAQDVINKEIGDYDILVGMMWKRFGTPTKNAKSGTEEEFERAYRYFKEYNRPKIMFYFRVAPFYTKDLKEFSQFQKVLRFRKKLEKLGVFFWEYNEPIDFERRIREHLIKQTNELARKPEKSVAPRLFFSCVRKDIKRVEPIYEAMKAVGFAPWMDVKDMAAGQNWESQIEKEITSTDFFVPFLSRETHKGAYVWNETDIAIKHYKRKFNKRIFPITVRLDPVEIPPSLAMFESIDVYSTDDYQKLISKIKNLL